MARSEQHVAKFDKRSGFIDLFWPGVLLVEQKSAGRDLLRAYEQAGVYFDALPERERPRFILVSELQTIELRDLDERETVTFPLADLPTHVESFGFILGVQRRTCRDQDPANIEAAELVGRLHDALADLYDPDLTPLNLRRAHRALDRAVDRLYRRSGFASERERVEHLFTLFEKMHTPLAAATKGRRRGKR